MKDVRSLRDLEIVRKTKSWLRPRGQACKKCLFRLLFVVYLCLVLYSLFNYRSQCIYTHPKVLTKSHMLPATMAAKMCHVDWDMLTVPGVDIFNIPSTEAVQKGNPKLQKGGSWTPDKCNAWQKVAVIIPYRNRWPHLKLLLHRLHPMLQRQNSHYRIFVIEQGGDEKFNRGKLMNVGFKEAFNYDKFDCFIFHDVDLIPENDKNLYLCDDHVRQLSSAIDEMRYHVMFYNYAGGVIAINKNTFEKINGYPNFYWGWGNEDDDISARTQAAGFLLTRPPEHIGRYKMVRHEKETRSEGGYEKFTGWRGRWMKDGLYGGSNMNYSVQVVTNDVLYTNITVDIGKAPKFEPDLSPESTQETWWWFLKFYFP